MSKHTISYVHIAIKRYRMSDILYRVLARIQMLVPRYLSVTVKKKCRAVDRQNITLVPRYLSVTVKKKCRAVHRQNIRIQSCANNFESTFVQPFSGGQRCVP